MIIRIYFNVDVTNYILCRRNDVNLIKKNRNYQKNKADQ